MRLLPAMSAIALGMVSATAWSADYHEPDSTNAFGRKHPGDEVMAVASPPGTPTSGANVNSGGWNWAPQDFTHFKGTVYPIEGGTHAGLFQGTYTVSGGTGDHELTWDANSSGQVMSVKITASPKNNRILVGGISTVKCAIKPGPDEAVHWAHVGVTSFAPNDDVKAVTSVMTASTTPTGTEDADKLSVELMSDSTVRDETPLNITHPAHVTGQLLGNTAVTQIVSAALNATAKTVLAGGATYVIQDQFRKGIDQSEFGGRTIYYREDTPLKATSPSLVRIAAYCANFVTAQSTWVAVPHKSTFNDGLSIIGVPMGDLIIADKKNPKYGSFDVSWSGKTIMEMQTHVWNLSVDKTILPTPVTANPFTLVVSAITPSQATVVGTYTLVTP